MHACKQCLQIVIPCIYLYLLIFIFYKMNLTCSDVDWCSGLVVWSPWVWTRHNLPVICWQQPLITVFMCPHCQIHPVLSQQRLQTPPLGERQAGPGPGLEHRAVVPVVVGAVHRSVAVHHQPGGQGSVHSGQVILQPAVLSHHLLAKQGC